MPHEDRPRLALLLVDMKPVNRTASTSAFVFEGTENRCSGMSLVTDVEAKKKLR
jgi:hypothetical protein